MSSNVVHDVQSTAPLSRDLQSVSSQHLPPLLDLLSRQLSIQCQVSITSEPDHDVTHSRAANLKEGSILDGARYGGVGPEKKHAGFVGLSSASFGVMGLNKASPGVIRLDGKDAEEGLMFGVQPLPETSEAPGDEGRSGSSKDDVSCDGIGDRKSRAESSSMCLLSYDEDRLASWEEQKFSTNQTMIERGQSQQPPQEPLTTPRTTTMATPTETIKTAAATLNGTATLRARGTSTTAAPIVVPTSATVAKTKTRKERTTKKSKTSSAANANTATEVARNGSVRPVNISQHGPQLQTGYSYIHHNIQVQPRYHQIHSGNYQVQPEYHQFQSGHHHQVLPEYHQIQSAYTQIRPEYDQLQPFYPHVRSEYTQLPEDHHQLHKGYNHIQQGYSHLQQKQNHIHQSCSDAQHSKGNYSVSPDKIWQYDGTQLDSDTRGSSGLPCPYPGVNHQSHQSHSHQSEPSQNHQSKQSRSPHQIPGVSTDCAVIGGRLTSTGQGHFISHYPGFETQGLIIPGRRETPMPASHLPIGIPQTTSTVLPYTEHFYSPCPAGNITYAHHGNGYAAFTSSHHGNIYNFTPNVNFPGSLETTEPNRTTKPKGVEQRRLQYKNFDEYPNLTRDLAHTSKKGIPRENLLPKCESAMSTASMPRPSNAEHIFHNKKIDSCIDTHREVSYDAVGVFDGKPLRDGSCLESKPQRKGKTRKSQKQTLENMTPPNDINQKVEKIRNKKFPLYETSFSQFPNRNVILADSKSDIASPKNGITQREHKLGSAHVPSSISIGYPCGSSWDTNSLALQGNNKARWTLDCQPACGQEQSSMAINVSCSGCCCLQSKQSMFPSAQSQPSQMIAASHNFVQSPTIQPPVYQDLTKTTHGSDAQIPREKKPTEPRRHGSGLANNHTTGSNLNTTTYSSPPSSHPNRTYQENGMLRDNQQTDSPWNSASTSVSPGFVCTNQRDIAPWSNQQRATPCASVATNGHVLTNQDYYGGFHSSQLAFNGTRSGPNFNCQHTHSLSNNGPFISEMNAAILDSTIPVILSPFYVQSASSREVVPEHYSTRKSKSAKLLKSQNPSRKSQDLESTMSTNKNKVLEIAKTSRKKTPAAKASTRAKTREQKKEDFNTAIERQTDTNREGITTSRNSAEGEHAGNEENTTSDILKTTQVGQHSRDSRDSNDGNTDMPRVESSHMISPSSLPSKSILPDFQSLGGFSDTSMPSIGSQGSNCVSTSNNLQPGNGYKQISSKDVSQAAPGQENCFPDDALYYISRCSTKASTVVTQVDGLGQNKSDFTKSPPLQNATINDKQFTQFNTDKGVSNISIKNNLNDSDRLQFKATSQQSTSTCTDQSTKSAALYSIRRKTSESTKSDNIQKIETYDDCNKGKVSSGTATFTSFHQTPTSTSTNSIQPATHQRQSTVYTASHHVEQYPAVGDSMNDQETDLMSGISAGDFCFSPIATGADRLNNHAGQNHDTLAEILTQLGTDSNYLLHRNPTHELNQTYAPQRCLQVSQPENHKGCQNSAGCMYPVGKFGNQLNLEDMVDGNMQFHLTCVSYTSSSNDTVSMASLKSDDI